MIKFFVNNETVPDVRKTDITISLEYCHDKSHVNLVINGIYMADITEHGLILHDNGTELPESIKTRNNYLKVRRD